MANKRKETSTTDFFLSVVHKEENEKKKQIANNPVIESKDKASNFVGTIITLVNEIFDSIIKNKFSSVVLSGIIAALLFMMISGGSIFTTTSSGTTLKNVPVTVEGLDEKYEISGVPDTIDIGIIGPSIDITSLTLSGNYQAYINVKGLEEGTHTISVETRNFPDSLDVMVVPQSFTITISPKVSQKFSLGYKYINEDEMNSNYSVYVKEMAVKSVTVRASEDTLQKIEKVVACIDVDKVESDFEQDASIKAFDSKGKEVSVDIAPNTVRVECGVSKYAKVVPIHTNFIGTPKEGYAVSNYKLSTSQVKVFGSEEELKDLENVVVDVDLTDISENTVLKKLKVKCDLAYNKLSVNTINVDIELDSVGTVTFEDLEIQVRNLTEGYTATISDKATVDVKGSTSLLQQLTSSDIEVYVDANEMKKGTHSVTVQVEGQNSDTLTYTLTSNQKVNLVIGG